MNFVVDKTIFDFDSKNVALTDGKSEISYQEMYGILKEIIQFLKINNIKSLAIYSKNSIEWCIVYLSCFFSDIKVFPISKQMKKLDLISLCNTVGINAVISDEKNDIELSNNVYDLPGCLSTQLYKLNEINYDDEIADVSTVLYTSGTTGEQKGVMLTHENILCNIQSVKQYMNYSLTDMILIVKPLCHSSTLTAEFLTGIYSGSSLFIFSETFNPLKVINIINLINITVLCGVPTIFAMLVRYQEKYNGSLRAVSVSGSYLDNKLLFEMKDMFRCDVYHVYGLTEASPRVTYLDPKYVQTKAGSIGKPIPNVEVQIVDENGSLISTSCTIGELVVKGRNIMKGYYKNSELTKEVIKNGSLYTKDLAYMDDEGFIFLCGRKDEMIARGGLNIWPEPIERVIRKLGYIEDVAVIGAEDYFCSQKLIAFVVSKGCVNENDVAKVCMEHNVICPDTIEKVDRIPRNAMGKIERIELKKYWIRKKPDTTNANWN